MLLLLLGSLFYLKLRMVLKRLAMVTDYGGFVKMVLLEMRQISHYILFMLLGFFIVLKIEYGFEKVGDGY